MPGWGPRGRAGAEMVYQFERPFVVDGSAWTARTGVTATPYAKGVARTLAGTADTHRALPI